PRHPGTDAAGPSERRPGPGNREEHAPSAPPNRFLCLYLPPHLHDPHRPPVLRGPSKRRAEVESESFLRSPAPPDIGQNRRSLLRRRDWRTAPLVGRDKNSFPLRPILRSLL